MAGSEQWLKKGVAMKSGGMAITCAIAASILTTAAAGRTPPRKENSPVFDNLLACRGIGDAAARVACYDTAVAALQEARDKKEVVVLDREGVKQAKRSIFGFSLPKLKLFGGSDKDEPEVTEITSTLSEVKPASYGLYFYALEDGSVWQTTEPQGASEPRRGQSITIKAGMLGSYISHVGKDRGVKVKRIR